MSEHDPHPPWEPTYEAHSGDATVDRLMALAFAIGAPIARTEELRAPALVCLTEDGLLQSHRLVTRGVPIGPMCHVVLHAVRATHAAVCCESWQVELPMTDEMRADHAAGRPVRTPADVPRPSQHPNRSDVLVLIGEARGRAQVLHRWQLVPGPDGVRELLPIADQLVAPSNLNPLFRSHDEIKGLIRAYAELQRLADQARTRQN